MNRHERRARKAKVGSVIWAEVYRDRRDGLLYWFERPEGFNRQDGVPPGVELHGPFKTREEVGESQRLVLLGPQCKVIDGGVWNPEWDKPEGTVLQ